MRARSRAPRYRRAVSSHLFVTVCCIVENVKTYDLPIYIYVHMYTKAYVIIYNIYVHNMMTRRGPHTQRLLRVEGVSAEIRLVR